MKWFGSTALSALCSTIKTENTTFQETVGDTINEVYDNMDDIDSRVTTLEGKADNDTTYTAGTGLALSGTTFNHSNSVTAGTAGGTSTSTLSHGGTFNIPTITYDAQGHITATGTTTLTLPSSGNTDRYVNTAAFAQDTTNNNVKMTLTRAGSDTSTVTANIPASSSSAFGVMKTGTGLSASSGTVSLASVSTSATTSTTSPAHGGTFTAVDGVTTDDYGRVTAVNTKTVTLPTDTDTKATQTITTTNADYRVILSANANDTTETSTLRKSAGILANASTGEIYAQGYRRIDISGQTIDLDDLTVSSGSPHIVWYIE